MEEEEEKESNLRQATMSFIDEKVSIHNLYIITYITGVAQLRTSDFLFLRK